MLLFNLCNYIYICTIHTMVMHQRLGSIMELLNPLVSEKYTLLVPSSDSFLPPRALFGLTSSIPCIGVNANDEDNPDVAIPEADP
jgi:hypothetical protein